MAEEKKKLSVAEILAAARAEKAAKAAAAGGAAANEPAANEPAANEPAANEPAASEPAAEAAPSAAAAEKIKPAAKPPAAKPGVGSGPGGRMSVAEMMAAARAEKSKPVGEASAPAAKPAAAKPAAPKPAAKPAVKAEKPVKDESSSPVEPETSSILAAARSGVKPGPMSKAEAAAKGVPLPKPAAPAKLKAFVPPMPQKPDYAKPKVKPSVTGENRRGFLEIMFGTMFALGMTCLSLVGGLWTLGFAKFMFPNILTEPPSRFKVGFPANFAPGQVETKFVAQFGVWIVNFEYQGQPEIYALRTVCTHLGCTPNWLEGEQKFKCPCHGSGFYKDGINFEGPAPRPLERFAIRISDDGQLEVDKSKLFQEEIGQWADPSSYVVA